MSMSEIRSQPHSRVGFLEHEDGALGEIGEPTSSWSTSGLLHETGGAFEQELPPPGVKAFLCHASERCEFPGRKATALPGIKKEDLLWAAKGLTEIFRLSEDLPAALATKLLQGSWLLREVLFSPRKRR
jgi:hypothetical protein